MTFTMLCLLAMLVLWTFQKDPDCKWWLAYAIIITAVALIHPVNTIEMVVTVGVWKVIKDICSR